MSRSLSANARRSNAGDGKHAGVSLEREPFRKFQRARLQRRATRMGALFLPCFRALEVLIQVAALGRF